jgi:hypothetical protein
MKPHSDHTVSMPAGLLAQVEKVADEEHRPADELVCDAVERYLQQRQVQRSAPNGTVFAQGLGLFGSPEDTALLDEVVSIAYEERRRPAPSGSGL